MIFSWLSKKCVNALMRQCYISAKSIVTSRTVPHSEYYSHPPSSEYFVDKDLIETKKGFGSTFYPSTYVMEELNANAMEFTTVSHKKENLFGEAADEGDL
uniref:Uncharacterized protein n=1 Tax=Parascaris univalens TaxID=6257 RepID=A0A915A0Q5_PARUN